MKEINQTAPVKCIQTILINATPERIWATLAGINQWAAWQTDISVPRLNGELKAGTGFDWKSGGMSIRSLLHTVEPRHAMGWTGKTLGLFAIHNWRLTRKEGQTLVTVEESMQGVLATLFKNMLNKSLNKGLQKWLELLKKECEN